MLKSIFAFAALSAAVFGAQAFSVSADSTSQAQSGPQPATSYVSIKDGVVSSIFAGANGSANAGPTGAGVTSAYADTSQISGPLITVSTAYAELATGTLRNYVEAPGGPGIGFSQASANSRWVETVTFNNTSGQTVGLGISWLTEGVVTDSSGTAWGSQNITSGIFLSNVNDSTLADIRFKDTNAANLDAESSGAQFIFGTFGGFGSGSFAFAPAGNNLDGIWTTSGGGLGVANGSLAATLLVPNGMSAITIDAQLYVDCRTGAICDFGNTASFSFAPLPDGLSFTSDSGVFLTAAIPEPATYALFSLGLLSVAFARRKRR